MWWDSFASGRSGLRPLLARAEFDGRALDAWLADVMAERSLVRSDVIRASRLNPTFGYQIIAGQRRASRDKLIQLAFGLGLGASDACELLERGGASALRSFVRRDFIIAYALERGLSLPACDDLLWGQGEQTIQT